MMLQKKETTRNNVVNNCEIATGTVLGGGGRVINIIGIKSDSCVHHKSQNTNTRYFILYFIFNNFNCLILNVGIYLC